MDYLSHTNRMIITLRMKLLDISALFTFFSCREIVRQRKRETERAFILTCFE